MGTKSFIFSVALLVSITLRPILISELQSAEQQKDGKQKQRLSKPLSRVKDQDQTSKEAQKGANTKQESTVPTPVTIEGTVSIQQEAKPWWEKPEWWTLILAAIASMFAYLAFRAASRQAKASEDQLAQAKKEFAHAISPRLHIDGVRVVDFDVGRQPTFFVKIVNSGPVAAKKVEISIRIESSIDGGVRPKSQAITIPANDSWEYPLNWPIELSSTSIERLSSENGKLRVRGSFQEPKRDAVEYCYKYYPWSGRRPEGVSQFIPCEFDTARTVSLSITGKSRIDPAGSVTNLPIRASEDPPSKS